MTRHGTTAACPPETRVVGIGASAGGITALQDLFESLTDAPSLAFVVLLHRPSDQPSSLATLLAGWAAMPVEPAMDGVVPQANRIYVPEPGDIVTLERGVFRTRPFAGGARRPGLDTIDAFLESLAADRGQRAVAVVLSGTGMDGTAGAAQIRQAGGIVLAQDPLTALHHEMPTAAITRGIVDETLPPGGIADRLAACGAERYVRPASGGEAPGDLARTLDRILAVVRARAGFDLRGYKPSPLLWRIQQRMDARRVDRFAGYLDLLQADAGELDALVRGIPIHVTGFFRDPEAWTVLRDAALAPIARGAAADGIRAWTPACATGEEAYSLAMLLAEHAAADFRIFASDAAPTVLAQASRGRFTAAAVAPLSAERRSRFFDAADGMLRFDRDLRRKMVFAPQDLLADPPFGDLDLITCRNLLIYLEPEAIERALATLHGALRPGGYLMLGKGETMAARQAGFETVSPTWNLHRKIGPWVDAGASRPVVMSGARSALSGTADAADGASDAPPSVLVDERLRILRVYGDTATILRLPEGPPTDALPGLLRPAWRADLQRAARDALAHRRPLSVALLEDPAMTLRLTPLDGEDGTARLMIAFVRGPAIAADSDGTSAPAESDAMRRSRAALEASRAELRALGAELKAANAQLADTSRDLDGAQAQLRASIGELDMQRGILGAGAVMALCLDETLRIRWFTPAIDAAFPLRPSDAGRAITDFAPRLDDAAFLADARAVLHDGRPREADVQDRAGLWYMRCIRSHAADGARSAGVAVTFTEITARHQDADALIGQNAAFGAAMGGAPLASALDVLARTAIARADDDARCAFFLAEAGGAALTHVTGMPDGYARDVEACGVGPAAAACGLAIHTGRPVIASDVTTDPRWVTRRPVAAAFDIRACWCFPIETAAAGVLGALAIYHRAPRAPTARELDLARVLARAASIIIVRHVETVARGRAEAGLRESRGRLARALDVTRRRRTIARA